MRNEHIDNFPRKPVISRFVAPWDTSGWYGVWPDLQPGSRLYTNSEAQVAQLPEKYKGVPYIRTYNSNAEGFDDKQEVDFYVEQDAVVYAALDDRCVPDFLEQFQDSGDVLTSTDGTVYRIFLRKYASGAQVHIPGFKGPYNHYIVFALPTSREYAEHHYDTAQVPVTLEPYQKRSYQWYFYETFNHLEDGTCPQDFCMDGTGGVRTYRSAPQRKYLYLGADSRLYRKTQTTGKDVFETSFTAVYGESRLYVCGVELCITPQEIRLPAQQRVLAKSTDGTYQIQIKRDPAAARSEIWINSRLQCHVTCSEDKIADFSICTMEGACGQVDFLSLRDETEDYVVEDHFEELPKLLRTSHADAAEFAADAFPACKGLRIHGKKQAWVLYPFQPVSGIVRIETRVKVCGDGFALLPELRNSRGELLARVAMYYNNLYVSNGDRWEQIFDPHGGWFYYPCHNWYEIQIVADTNTCTYAVMVDGAKRADGLPLLSKTDDAAQLGFFTDTDDLLVSSIQVSDTNTFSRHLLPPGKLYDVTQAPYCAAGDGRTLDTEAIQRALNDAACMGGTVYLPHGTFFTGSLRIYSDTTFFLDTEAELIGTQDHSQYPLYTPGESLCAARQLGRSLLYAENARNIRITGGGTINGNGLYRFKMNDPKNDRENDSRPCAVYTAYCENVRIDNLSFKNAAFWTVVPLSSRNVFMEHLDLDCMNTPNRDGIDPVDCVDMTIRKCRIMAGDDGLCLKSSDILGCENIFVSDLMIQSLASGIKFGTDTYYSFRNAVIQRCTIKNVNRCGISLESVDGAAVENVRFDQIDMTDVGAPIYVVVGKRGRCPRGTHEQRASTIDGVEFHEIHFERPYPFSFTKDIRETMVIGQSPEQPVKNITFSQCEFNLPGGRTERPDRPQPIGTAYPEYDCHGLSAGSAYTFCFAEHVKLLDCKVQLDQEDCRPVAAYVDCGGKGEEPDA